MSVVEQVKSFILANRLSPGDPLPTENELSASLGVSRTRIREAMKTLSALDIVEVRHGHGTYVGAMGLTALVESLAFRGALASASENLHVLSDVIDLREVIEVAVAPRVIQSLGAQAALTMKSLVSTMVEKAARHESFRDEDREFHVLYMQASGNALAAQLTSAFWEVHDVAASALAPIHDLRASAQDHQKIIDAIEHGDLGELTAALHEHYGPVQGRIQDSTPE